MSVVACAGWYLKAVANNGTLRPSLIGNHKVARLNGKCDAAQASNWRTRHNALQSPSCHRKGARRSSLVISLAAGRASPQNLTPVCLATCFVAVQNREADST
jgi:hypothetical protein